MGASIRGAKFNNLPLVKNISIFEITNLSIGIQDYQNKFLKIIERGNPIPYENKKIFFTSKNYQTRASISIYESEDYNICDKNNLLLGQFMIKELPKKKSGEIKLALKFKVKENSMLEVISSYQQHDQAIDKDLIIERPKELLNIMEQLKEK